MNPFPIRVSPVVQPAELDAFIRFPFRLYRGDPRWVPPLIYDVKRRLCRDPRRNPFFEHAEAQLWTAWRGGTMVGRIGAHIDHDYNRFHDARTGWFGWYESEDDPAVAQAMMEQAAAWCRDRGMDTLLGPGCYTTNDGDLGFRVDASPIAPMILNPHTASYYPRLMERLGFEKAMDLLCYRMDTDVPTPPPILQLAEHMEKREGVVVRAFDPRRFEDELRRFREIYNAAWERNWGFVPLRDREFVHHARDLKPILWPDFAFFAEVNGIPAGAALTLPNLNEVLIRLNGRLLPTGWWRLWRGARRVKTVRVFALGVKREYREMGLGALFYHRTLEAGKRRGIRWGEMSWILENNRAMNSGIRSMGGELYMTYRLYHKAI